MGCGQSTSRVTSDEDTKPIKDATLPVVERQVPDQLVPRSASINKNLPPELPGTKSASNKDPTKTKPKDVDRIASARHKRQTEAARELIELANKTLPKNEHLKVTSKTETQDTLLLDATSGVFLFNQLPIDVQRALVDLMYPQQYEDGQIVIKEGEANPNMQRFYVIKSGNIELYQHLSGDEESEDTVTTAWSGGDHVRLLSTLGPEECCGEDAMLYNKKDVTALAVGKVEVFVLDQRTYNAIKFAHSQKVEKDKKKLIATVQSFGTLTEEQLNKVLDALEPITYEEGERIMVKGEVGDRFYILQDGEVEVQEEEGITKCRLGAGSFFGEKALLHDIVRTASVIAAGSKGASCYYLDREAFQDLLGPVEDVWRWATLRSVPILSPLTDEQIMELVIQLQPVEFTEGAWVFTKGTRGDSVYVVESGEFLVLGNSKSSKDQGSKVNAKNVKELDAERRRASQDARTLSSTVSDLDNNGVDMMELARLEKGSVFGEYALLSEHPRTASVKCVSDKGTVLELSRTTFASTMGSLVHLEEEWRLQSLRRVPCMAGLSRKDKLALSKVLVPCSFDDGEVIYSKGSKGDTMYIVETGQVESASEDGTKRLLTTGMFFGEQSLVSQTTRKETVKASGTPLILSLAREDCGALSDKIHALLGGAVAARNPDRDGSALPSTVDQLEELAVIGAGGYGKVVLVRYKDEVHALKSILKQALLKMDLAHHLEQERVSMIECRCKWVVDLKSTYQDKDYVFMLIDAVMGGDLRRYVMRQPNRRIPEHQARFYIACVIQALEAMHSLNYVHRDLKTENLLIMPNGYVKLADFGFAKKLPKGKKTYTTCGTPAYMAPEIITMAGHTTAVDWWCIGILLYEMTCGYTPFQYETNELHKLRAIVDGKFTIPNNLSSSCRSLIAKLLTTNPARRLGNLKRGSKDVKMHSWFNGFDWNAHSAMEMKAPYVPDLKAKDDTKYVLRQDESTLRKIWKMEQKFKDPPRRLPDKDKFSNF